MLMESGMPWSWRRQSSEIQSECTFLPSACLVFRGVEWTHVCKTIDEQLCVTVQAISPSSSLNQTDSRPSSFSVCPQGEKERGKERKGEGDRLGGSCDLAGAEEAGGGDFASNQSILPTTLVRSERGLRRAQYKTVLQFCGKKRWECQVCNRSLDDTSLFRWLAAVLHVQDRFQQWRALGTPWAVLRDGWKGGGHTFSRRFISRTQWLSTGASRGVGDAQRGLRDVQTSGSVANTLRCLEHEWR